MKTCLVTGGAGFIGSHFIEHMRKQQPRLTIVNLDKLTYAGNLENCTSFSTHPSYHFVRGDICDRELVAALFQKYCFTWVVNFAAESHVDRSIADASVFAKTNVEGVLSLLDCAYQFWATSDGEKKFIQISTDEVYGSLGQTGYFSETSPLHPRNPYSATKAGADLLALSYYHTHGLPVAVTRSANNYGPNQYPEKLIPLLVKCCLEHKPFPVYGDGLQVRDWIYVLDHCSAVEHVLFSGKPGEIYNVGANCEKTNIEIVRQVLRCMEAYVDPSILHSLPTYVTDRKGHDRRYALDCTKIRAQLGWQPAMEFSRGLQLTVDALTHRMKNTHPAAR